MLFSVTSAGLLFETLYIFVIMILDRCKLDNCEYYFSSIKFQVASIKSTSMTSSEF